jgi:hypothetical protein
VNKKNNVQEARSQPVVEKVAPGETLRRINIEGNRWPQELTHCREPEHDFKKAFNLKGSNKTKGKVCELQ